MVLFLKTRKSECKQVWQLIQGYKAKPLERRGKHFLISKKKKNPQCDMQGAKGNTGQPTLFLDPTLCDRRKLAASVGSDHSLLASLGWNGRPDQNQQGNRFSLYPRCEPTASQDSNLISSLLSLGWLNSNCSKVGIVL